MKTQDEKTLLRKTCRNIAAELRQACMIGDIAEIDRLGSILSEKTTQLLALEK